MSQVVNLILVGIFSAILGKVRCVHDFQKNFQCNLKFFHYHFSTINNLQISGSAIPVVEVAEQSANIVDNSVPDSGIVIPEQNENLSTRQEPTPSNSAVDSIEDAILAALETAQLEDTTPRPRPTLATNRPRPVSVTQTPPQQPEYFPQQQQPQLPPTFGQFGIGGNRFPGQGQGLLLPWDPLHPLTATGSPLSYLPGIVGNLAGVADNTLKLVGSSTNAFLGVAGHVSCTLNPMLCINKG